MNNVGLSVDLSGQCAVVTGGSGVLGSVLARALAASGARVAVLGRRVAKCQAVVDDIRRDGGDGVAIACDVLDTAAVQAAADTAMQLFGKVDILLNGAGGSDPRALTSPTQPFFDLPIDVIQQVVDLNLLGTIRPSQIIGRHMAARKQGCIINIASMTTYRPLTRTIAYSAGKAAVGSFTQWLAVNLAQAYGPGLRVNAIAPGFFLTELNHKLLIDEATGESTPRGKAILAHTPMGRLGQPEELVGALLWLVSPAASFVTGITIPVDGGFLAFAGV